MTTMERELRLALGMRGGVSLAVWIGGACAEIERLRQGDEFWHRLLRNAGYSAVTVDVMSGASAGGLNAVLLAAAQQYGFDFAAMRDIWLDVGGMERLVRRDVADAPSLLDGDGAFLDVLHDRLLALIDAAPSRPDLPPTVDVRLTATHVEPIMRRSVSPKDELLAVPRSSGSFRFRRIEGADWLPSDFPPYAPPPAPGADPSEARRELDAAVWRLALAGRATSSFPVAFEAAAVRSRRPDRFGATRPGAPGRLVDMFGVFSDARGRGAADPVHVIDDDFVILDGGWLDNIPLRTALDAIEQSPAASPTSRYLVYLQPDDDSIAGPRSTAPDASRADRQAARRSTVNVATGMVKSVRSAETIAADIAALEDHNRSVARSAAIRQATFHPPGDSELPVAELAARAWPTYRVLRATEDAHRLHTLLDDPISVLGEDPFPFDPRQNGNRHGDLWRAPLTMWTEEWRRLFDRETSAAFAAPPSGAEEPTSSDDVDPRRVLTNGLGPMVRLCRLLLEWSSWLGAEGDVTANNAKHALYRTRLFVEQVLNRNRRLSWVVSATDPHVGTAPFTSWVEQAMDDANALLDCPASLAARIAEALRDGDGPGSDAIDDYQRLAASRLQGQMASAEDAPPVAGDHARRAVRDGVINDVLVPLVERLEALPPPAVDRPARILHRVLADTSVDRVLRLARLEVLCLPEFLSGAPGMREIAYVKCSSANPTSFAAKLTDLQARARELGIDWPSADHVPVPLKLAGNELFHFAAFFAGRWRANDWMWGRLDAVPTLVELLVDDTNVSGLARAGEDLAEVRTRLIAERQEQIAKAELVLAPWPNVPADTPLDDTWLDGCLKEFAVGAETFTHPRLRDHVEVAQRLALVAGRTIRWNAGVAGPSLNGSSPLQKAAALLARVVTRGGTFAASAVLAPRSRERSSGPPGAAPARRRWLRLLIGLCCAVVLGAFAFAVLLDWKAAAIAAATTGVVLVGAVLVLLLRTRPLPEVRSR